ncbi:MAG: hypothetical protein EAZ44_03680 [Cytophagia bacterium]|nr:MAG: hypothetical protein EAZ44_03680 [Cytophagia bacterium]TAG43872.1 MAG: hypothetical protein EAZ31_03420 [Cytophagia bacterium]TAH30139.1 MAG: hypothetical protein EAZ06_04195 [Cytophagales bacterium]
MNTESLSLSKYLRDMSQQNVILTFKGTISQEILADVGINLRSRLGSFHTGKRIFAIFVELAQNIYHHSAQKEFSASKGRPAGVGMLAIQDSNDHFILSSGNLIENYKVEGLKERCQFINQMTSEELRTYYMQQRKRPTGGVGANIGLIDMARRSKNPLQYDIQDVDDDTSFFALSITVNKIELENETAI